MLLLVVSTYNSIIKQYTEDIIATASLLISNYDACTRQRYTIIIVLTKLIILKPTSIPVMLQLKEEENTIRF
jgi:hypothetical protein